MSVFGMPDDVRGGAAKPDRGDEQTAFDVPREMAAAMRLMVNPVAGAMALSALGFGIASHAFGLWAGAVVGFARASRRSFPAGEDEQAAEIPIARRGRPTLKVVPKTAPSPQPVAPSEPGAAPIAAVAETSRKIPPAPKTARPMASKAGTEKPVEPVQASGPAPVVEVAKSGAALLPEDFHRPRSVDRPAAPDDLKAISGIGPKLEKVLNDLGVWTYAQIAAWEPREVAWLDDYLSFTGRIDRDGWIEQAAKLAGGKKKGK